MEKKKTNPAPSMMQSMKMFFRRYAGFKGRSRRAEYWKVALFYLLLYIPLVVVLGTAFAEAVQEVGVEQARQHLYSSMNAGTLALCVLYGVYTVVVIVPGCALSVRHFHGVGRSGWIGLVLEVCGLFPASLTGLAPIVQLS